MPPMADAWAWPNFRYENDDVAQFTLVLDAIEEALRCLQARSVGEHRLGLVVTDYVADIVLARRVESMVKLSQEGGGWMEPRPRFDRRDRSRLRQGFNRRLAVAARSYERRFSLGFGKPIIDDADAEILRVAHAYRNDAYHEDRHNERTLPVIAGAALHAATRAWTGSHSTKSASSWGAKGPLMDRLQAIGYESPGWLPSGTGSYLSLHAGAAAVSRWLERELPVSLSDDAATLSGDIAARTEWAESMLAWLAGRQGPGPNKIAPALRWHEFWQQRGDDPELLECEEARAVAFSAYMDADESEREELAGPYRAVDDAYEARIVTLMREFKPTLGLASLPQLAKRGEALTTVSDRGRLLGRYQQIDMDMRVVEDTLVEIAVGWDRAVEAESERRRGK
jgi:hypothetical protein